MLDFLDGGLIVKEISVNDNFLNNKNWKNFYYMIFKSMTKTLKKYQKELVQISEKYNDKFN